MKQNCTFSNPVDAQGAPATSSTIVFNFASSTCEVQNGTSTSIVDILTAGDIFIGSLLLPTVIFLFTFGIWILTKRVKVRIG